MVNIRLIIENNITMKLIGRFMRHPKIRTSVEPLGVELLDVRIFEGTILGS